MDDDIHGVEGPITAALFETALMSVWNLYERLGSDAHSAPPGAKMFADPELLLKQLQEAWANPKNNGEASVENLWSYLETDDQVLTGMVVLLVVDAIIAYATEAMKAEQQGDVAAAWKYVGEARYWEGVLNAMRMEKLLHRESLSASLAIENPAVLMANRRHAANLAEKESIVEYWKANVDPNLSAAKAATQIITSGKFGLEYRTVQALISAVKKGRWPV